MEEHLQQIRAAFEARASAEARQVGMLACRALLSALEIAPVHSKLADVEIAAASAGDAMAPASETTPEELPELCDPQEVPPAAAPSPAQPAAPAAPPPPPSASAIGGIDPAALAAIVTTIRSLSPDQWMDLLIDKLRSAVRSMPTAAAAPMVPTAPVAFSHAAPQPLRFRFVPVPPAPKR